MGQHNGPGKRNNSASCSRRRQPTSGPDYEWGLTAGMEKESNRSGRLWIWRQRERRKEKVKEAEVSATWKWTWTVRVLAHFSSFICQTVSNHRAWALQPFPLNVLRHLFLILLTPLVKPAPFFPPPNPIADKLPVAELCSEISALVNSFQ